MNKVVLVVAIIALSFGAMILGERATATTSVGHTEQALQFRLNDAAQACNACL
jgi:hypothetical protein